MLDIQLIDNDSRVRFHKKLYDDSEIVLAKCFNFVYSELDNTFTAALDVTSKKALHHYLEITFKNFSQNRDLEMLRNDFWTRVDAYYTRRDTAIQGQLKANLPYYDRLYAHQREVISEAFHRQHNFLSMEMGTGKSLTSASISRALQLRRTVIVAPAAVKFNWFRELTEKFGFNKLYFTMYDAAKGRTFRAFTERFVIINYDILPRFMNEICISNIDHFIFDEMHLCKNYLSIRSQAVREIISRFPKAPVTMLSGTPISNRVNDVFAYLKAVGHELGKNHTKFLKEYTIMTKGRGGERVTGGQNLQDLHIKLSNFMIRRTKAECLDLPAKVYFSYKFELDDYRAEYNKIIADLAAQKEFSRLSANLHSLNIITSKSKHKGIIEIAETVLDEGRKVVMFSGYKEPLDDMEKHYGHRCVKIDGSVSSYMRDQLVQRFINDPECVVFLGNMKAAGVGINLVNASDVIFMDMPLVPSHLYQSTDRLHRIGQTESVNVHYTFCEDSIDQYIYEMLVDKDQDINTVIDNGKESQLNEDFTELLIKKLLKRDDITFKNPIHKKEKGGTDSEQDLRRDESEEVEAVHPESSSGSQKGTGSQEENDKIAEHSNSNQNDQPAHPTENIFARKLREQLLEEQNSAGDGPISPRLNSQSNPDITSEITFNTPPF